jgi:hypothetical protein
MVGASISNIAQYGVNIQIYTSPLYACRKRLRLLLNGRLDGPHGYTGSFGEETKPLLLPEIETGLFGRPGFLI